ncbi:DNA adenine methylase [Runella sp.]|uniref:DNA adenine methylase n=1 Tax=Runella sp. TaxID=1960881 RepID=UPI003D145B15
MIEPYPNKNLTPFLRWTGSKRWFTKDYLKNFLPEKFNNFHEPFLGAGAVFFYLKSQNKDLHRQFYLSDTNSDLINCYSQLKGDANAVIKFLSQYKNTEKDYYAIRASNPEGLSEQAARFIYLNRTSFNGIYRVNSNGVYNVPYGKRHNVDIVTERLLQEIQLLLNGSTLSNRSFEKSIDDIKEGDLVFIDPPYTTAHENNGFIEYNQILFSWEDQLKLKEYIVKIIEKKAFFILTNASHHSLLDLYNNLANIQKISRLSKVGGRNKTRGIYNELVIYNTNENYGQ